MVLKFWMKDEKHWRICGAKYSNLWMLALGLTASGQRSKDASQGRGVRMSNLARYPNQRPMGVEKIT